MKIEAKALSTENVCKPFYISLPLIISYNDTAEESPSTLALTKNKNTQYKPPRIGDTFQAVIPDVQDTDLSEQQNADEIVWRSNNILKDDEVKQFLKKAKHIFQATHKTSAWSDRHKEFFLTKLHNAMYDISKCLLELEEGCEHFKTPSECWNSIEETLFDSCHQPQIYHKDWHSMQAVIRTKSVSEIVDYYYWWKNKKEFSNFSLQDSKAVKQELLSMEQKVEDRDIPRLRRREKGLNNNNNNNLILENKKRTLNTIVDDHQLPLYYDISVTAGIDWDKVKQLEVKKRRLESPEHVQIGFPANMYHSHQEENLHSTLNADISHVITPTHETLHGNDFHHADSSNISLEKETTENDIDFQSWFSVNE